MEDPVTTLVYTRQKPALCVVDGFYRDPDAIRRLALDLEYAEDERWFKGQRSTRNVLLPYVKEEFERLLQTEITSWMNQTANGCFQKTTSSDPLVWHSDEQDYAAAIYLTPGAREAGTSFWQHFETDARRPPSDPALYAQTYTDYNLTHPDNWNLVDRIGAVYNRLVIWDAKLIHSASTYEGYTEGNPRLAQLFFFNVKQ